MRIEASETFRVAPDRLWPLLANTDSLNRELGLPNVDYTFTPLSQGGSAVRARTRVGLVTMEWDEHPFEWIWPREYSIRRVFHRGPMREFRAAFRFEPTGQGCRVGIQVDLEPAGLLGKLVAKPFGQKSLNQTIEATRNFERFLLGEIPSPYPNRFGRGVIDRPELEGRLRQLGQLSLDRALVDRLGRLVIEEVDEHICDLRPYEIADTWKADRFQVLRLCLYATRVGILDLRWHVICPS